MYKTVINESAILITITCALLLIKLIALHMSNANIILKSIVKIKPGKSNALDVDKRKTVSRIINVAVKNK